LERVEYQTILNFFDWFEYAFEIEEVEGEFKGAFGAGMQVDKTITIESALRPVRELEFV
jgi:hypothetical protein